MRDYARILSRKEGEGTVGEPAVQSATEFLTAAELAGRLRVQLETIRRWTRSSIIPAIRVTGKIVRYDPVDVERALRERSETLRGLEQRAGAR